VLTPRERQLFALLVQGMPYKEIAAELKISRRTVEHHRENVHARLQKEPLSDLFELNIYAGGIREFCPNSPNAQGPASPATPRTNGQTQPATPSAQTPA